MSYFSIIPPLQVAMSHDVLGELLSPVLALYEDVRRKALMRLEYEGLHRAEAISTPGARYHNNPAAFAMDRYAYYVCYKCNKVRKPSFSLSQDECHGFIFFFSLGFYLY